jgi:hypothetical protein
MRMATTLVIFALGCQPTAPREFAEVIEGALDEGDARLDDGSVYDAFELKAEKGQRLRATLESEDFDPSLQLLDAREKRVAANDDERFGVTRAKLDESIPEDGIYKLILMAQDRGRRGAYRLEVKLTDP